MVSINNGVGYLELIIGPMYSGKTSKLLAIKKKYDICNILVAIVCTITRFNQMSSKTMAYYKIRGFIKHVDR